jgi:hypothetical protein
VIWDMWNLVLVLLEIMLVSVQDRCMVCVKRTIGSEIILDAPDGLTCIWRLTLTRLKWMLVSYRLETVLIWTQDRCTVCAERAIGSEIISDTPDRTPW